MFIFSPNIRLPICLKIKVTVSDIFFSNKNQIIGCCVSRTLRHLEADLCSKSELRVDSFWVTQYDKYI